MQITRSSVDTAKGPADWFTGDVYIDAVAAAPPPSRVTANLVHFMPGARTHWHRHPLSQTVFVTEGVGHARELAKTAVRRGMRLVMAWGGDGTINEVASALAFDEVPLGIIPAGSGNGLARELGVARRPEQAQPWIDSMIVIQAIDWIATIAFLRTGAVTLSQVGTAAFLPVLFIAALVWCNPRRNGITRDGTPVGRGAH